MEAGSITYRSSRLGPLRPQLQLNGEFSDELSEEVLVGVLAHLIENKPISDLTLGENIFKTLSHIFIILVTNLVVDCKIDSSYKIVPF